MKSKILVLNPSSKINEIVTKANLQHSKNGPFESIILLNPAISPDTPFDQSTYFYDTNSKTIGPNLNAVNGVVKLANGINICFCGDDIVETEESIDILVAKSLPVVYDSSGNFNIDKMITKLKPRYVFCCGDFKEYSPFEWENGVITRVLSLNEEGQGKWFYAFNISKIPSEIDSRSLVSNPFIITKKRGAEEIEKEPKKHKVVTPQECFFCLSNPNVETHMIVTIESLSYLTVAKGPLTRYNKEIPFAGHGIIIPIHHSPMVDIASATYHEIVDFELKLVKAFQVKYPDFIPVFFDINLKTNIHYHKQFLPVHKRFMMANKFETTLEERVKTNNEKYVNNHKLMFKKVSEITSLHDKQFMMFKVYEDETPIIYVSIIEDKAPVDLQFPRRVLSSVLNSPKRLYWDKCKQGKHQEMRECEEFKKFLLP